MTFDMTPGKEPRYQIHIYGWNVDDKYLFSDYESAQIMYNDLIGMYGTFISDKPIITISDVITSERIKRNE